MLVKDSTDSEVPLLVFQVRSPDVCSLSVWEMGSFLPLRRSSATSYPLQ